MKFIKGKKIDFNEQFLHALTVMEETDKNVFVTGRAGTGKSTLLQYFRENTDKNVSVLAPTGVAAVNVKGQTIHSFFNFRIGVTPDTVHKIRPRDRDLYTNLDAIIIDEISMVRADLLDCVDLFLRKHGKTTGPFGGIQMIFIGDLYQLPPVVTAREKALFRDLYKSPYFFSSRVFDADLFSRVAGDEGPFHMEFIELEKVYRQKDERFLQLLNGIRNNSITEKDIEEINNRYDPSVKEKTEDFYIYLTTTNALADDINTSKLTELKADEHYYEGQIDGDFGEKSLPTSLNLTLRTGAQVMLLNNDPHGRWINGSIGRIADIDEEENRPDVLWIELPDGEVVDVTPNKWEMYEFSYDRETSRILSESVGAFTQYPLRLAWAVTIHKCQGMTFDRAVIDIGRGTFSHGQLYVALSRCTTLNGIVLKTPVYKKHVLLDRRVVQFVTRYQYNQAGKHLSLDDRVALLDEAIQKGRKLEIVYLKTGDEKSKRTILPRYVGEMEYQGRKFPGVQAFCANRQDERVFHLERILEMKLV
ncbi:MAG: AAA family ATPase [Nitrospiraceae bacterium]|nr:MAG: AAA family ATPase [Nitrospiraceae bacterium]